MKKNVLFIALITVLIKFLGFGRDMVFAFFFGASVLSDSYIVAQTIPITLFSIIGVGKATSYIPIYNKALFKESEDRAQLFSSNFLNCILAVCILVVIFVLYKTKFVVKLFAMGFDDATLKITIDFTRFSIFGIFASGIVFILNSFLHIKGNFLIPAVVTLPTNIVAVISFYLSVAYSNNTILAYGIAISVFSQLLIVIPASIKHGYRHRVNINLKDKYLRESLILTLPVIFGVSVNQLNVLVDRTLASQVAIGGITALNYANRLTLFIQGVIVLPVITVIYPSISKMVIESNLSLLRKTISDSLEGIAIFLLPITVGAMIFSEQITILLFGRGAFDTNAVYLTSSALFFYSLGLIGFGFREVLSRAFYSMNDTKTPMVNAAIAMIVNIILNFLLSRVLGIGGLALATSISSLFCTYLLSRQLRTKLGGFSFLGLTKSLVKIAFSSVTMGVIANFSFAYFKHRMSNTFALLNSIGLGVIFYFALIFLMDIEGVNLLKSQIRSKVNLPNKKGGI